MGWEQREEKERGRRKEYITVKNKLLLYNDTQISM